MAKKRPDDSISNHDSNKRGGPGANSKPTESETRSAALSERLRQLTCIFEIMRVIGSGTDEPENFIGKVVELLPSGFRRGGDARARITYGNQVFTSEDFHESAWKLEAEIVGFDFLRGKVEVFYLNEAPDADEGPFLSGERLLVDTVAGRLSMSAEQSLAEREALRYKDRIEEIVEKRTTELSSSNVQLTREVAIRKKAEEALCRSEEAYRSLADSITEVFFAVDRDFRISYWNRATETMTGISSIKALGRSLYDVLSDISAVEMERLLTVAMGRDTPIFRMIQLGSDKHYEVSMYPSSHGLSVFMKDITERHRAEELLGQYRNHLEELIEQRTRQLKDAQETLMASERLAAIGSFSGAVSHELRNPLGVISSSAFILKRLLDKDEPRAAEHLDRIQNSVQACADTMDGILRLTRMEDPRLRPDELKSILSLSIESSGIPKKICLEFSAPEEEVPLTADTEQLRMAFKNILKNAVQAMPGGGKITVVSRIREKSGRKVSETSISDTGPGISEENREKIFLPLFTTKRTGYGFGLHIVKMIIEKHGGAIRVEPSPDGGAAFIIELPMSEKQ